jgi:hypothetical protein
MHRSETVQPEAAMKGELMIMAALSLSVALTGEAQQLPPEQSAFLWSVAGTVFGAAGSAFVGSGGSMQRVLRGVVSFVGGMLLAPWAIASMPVADGTPHWWHAFAASGIGALVGSVLVAKGPSIALRLIEQRVGAATARKDNE